MLVFLLVMNETIKHSILIVDDDEINVEALERMLSYEYTVYTANDGFNAVKMAEERLPDLILLDIEMPGMDGYAVITKLKSTPETQKIPVIFITGLDCDDSEEKGLNLGAADYITKPFSFANVKLRVKKQIETLDQLRSIEKLSMIDQLTGLPNRRGLETRMHSEWARAQREHTPFSVLFLDIDRFKQYNDSYGHPQGDVLLKCLAKVFTETLKRPGDFAARWGGEEFLVLLPNTDLNGALEVAEHIRKNVEDVCVPCSDEAAAKITISIGVNTHVYGQDNTVDSLVAGADKALYIAKGSGRNKICHTDSK